MMKDEDWMRAALSSAKEAQAAGEVPVGCVIIKDNQLISRGFNSPISLTDPTAHAEIQALRHAGQVLDNYRLNDVTLYVTLEPCLMCLGAMLHARIGRLVFGAYDGKVGAANTFLNSKLIDRFNHTPLVDGGVLEKECSELLRSFFKQKR